MTTPTEIASTPSQTPPAAPELDREQRAAVEHDEGPLLVVAGAGTGKTTVIAQRIAALIASRRARPSEILALAFNDKAAAEMQERVDLLAKSGDLRTSPDQALHQVHGRPHSFPESRHESSRLRAVRGRHPAAGARIGPPNVGHRLPQGTVRGRFVSHLAAPCHRPPSTSGLAVRHCDARGRLTGGPGRPTGHSRRHHITSTFRGFRRRSVLSGR